MTKIKAPGKMMLSGEWSVLEIGNPCIVLAVDRFVEVSIKRGKGNKITINAPDFGIKKISAEFDSRSNKLKLLNARAEQQKTLSFVKNSIEATFAYLNQKKVKLQGFELTTKSRDTLVETPEGQQKIGFGSSAAVSVATVAAVLSLHKKGIKSTKEKERVFKLSCIAHFLGQGKIGSAFDVAASTFGGALIYKRFDAKWLETELKTKKILEVVDEVWPHLYFEQLKLPKDFEVVVGFSGKSASTKELVGKINEFKQCDNAQYQGIMQELKETTEQLIIAMKKGNEAQILGLIRQNRGVLKDLSDSSMNELETPELGKIIEIAEQNGAAGKFSGAGGGDCAIAVCFGKKTLGTVEKELKRAGFTVLEVKVAAEGACKVR